MKKYDDIIIGFGKGGKTLAGYLAKKGEKVAVIEKSNKMYGGTCINVGCIPSKSLVKNASKTAQMGDISFDEKSKLYKKAIEEKRNLTEMLRGKNYDKLNDLDNVDVINAKASFEDKNVVKITYKDSEELLHADKIYINTGSTSVIPKIEGIENNPYVYFSDTLMELDTLPNRLIIIGGGYIGLEFASMYSNFGSNVTVIQDGDKFIPREDEDIADEVKSLLENQGMEIKLGAKIKKFTKDGIVSYSHKGKEFNDKADAILVATGRKANTGDLNLEAAGVEVDKRGGIVVDNNLRTSNNNIWAMGDVNGGLQFTYVSLDDYRIIVSGLENKNKYNLSKRENVPYSVFMNTPLSRVGLNEREALEQGYDIKVLKLPVGAIPKAQVLKKPYGILKAIIDNKTNRILGTMLLCEESYEMINIVKLAMDLGADYTILKNQVFTHPTMSEALNDLFSL